MKPEIAANIVRLYKESEQYGARIVLVTKKRTVDEMLSAYKAGHKIFGENRDAELLEKYDQLPSDVEWHFVGHLQRNKVKNVVPRVVMIHSADSFRLLRALDKEADKSNPGLKVLLQIKIASEESKYGFSIKDITGLLDTGELKSLINLTFAGVMGMATLTNDTDQIRKEFQYLKKCFEQLKSEYFTEEEHFCEISMGMSGDYKIALEEGSTIIRVGQTVFGPRPV